MQWHRPGKARPRRGDWVCIDVSLARRGVDHQLIQNRFNVFQAASKLLKLAGQPRGAGQHGRTRAWTRTRTGRDLGRSCDAVTGAQITKPKQAAFGFRDVLAQKPFAEQKNQVFADLENHSLTTPALQ